MTAAETLLAMILEDKLEDILPVVSFGQLDGTHDIKITTHDDSDDYTKGARYRIIVDVDPR